MQCIIMENTLIKLTLHDETKKRAHDSQIVRAKENLKILPNFGCLNPNLNTLGFDTLYSGEILHIIFGSKA